MATTTIRRSGVVLETSSTNGSLVSRQTGAMVPKNADEMELAVVYEALQILSRRQQERILKLQNRIEAMKKEARSRQDVVVHVRSSAGSIVNITIR